MRRLEGPKNIDKNGQQASAGKQQGGGGSVPHVARKGCKAKTGGARAERIRRGQTKEESAKSEDGSRMLLNADLGNTQTMESWLENRGVEKRASWGSGGNGREVVGVGNHGGAYEAAQRPKLGEVKL